MKMPNKLLLPVIGLLVLGAGAFAYTRRPTSVPSAPANQTAGEAMDEAAEFAKAVQSGKPTICVMSKGQETMEYRIKGKKMRGNITAAAGSEGTPQTSHLISDESFFYIWVDGQQQGTKISLIVPSPSPAAAAEQPVTKFESEEDYQNLKNEGYAINCAAGNVSDSDFVPPANVTFQDLLTIMQQAVPSAGQGQIDYQKLQEQYGSLDGE